MGVETKYKSYPMVICSFESQLSIWISVESNDHWNSNEIHRSCEPPELFYYLSTDATDWSTDATDYIRYIHLILQAKPSECVKKPKLECPNGRF